MLQARMNHPAMVVPDALKTLQTLSALPQQGLSEKLLELVHLAADLDVELPPLIREQQ